jgi:uncharacterized membrane protein YhfC
MTGIYLHMQWPLTSQLHGNVSQREQLVFLLRIKLHALIQLGVSLPSLWSMFVTLFVCDVIGCD